MEVQKAVKHMVKPSADGEQVAPCPPPQHLSEPRP